LAPDRAEIATCLSDIRRFYAEDKSKDRTNDEWFEMIDATQRWISRDSSSEAEQIVARDKSMFRNFQWLRQQQPKRHKVILWAATVHIAKQGDPTWADQTGTNFGSFVHREYGAGAFSRGFSALTGTYRQGHFVHDQPPAPSDPLESQALGKSGLDAVYVGPAQLEAMGTLPGAIFRHSYQILQWSDFVDGVWSSEWSILQRASGENDSSFTGPEAIFTKLPQSRPVETARLFGNQQTLVNRARLAVVTGSDYFYGASPYFNARGCSDSTPLNVPTGNRQPVCL